jgi:hypothetical protein
MKVRIIENVSYVNLNHIIGNVYDAVKVPGNYSGYYVEVPISSTKTTSLYFLPYEVEEVDEYVETLRKYQSLAISVPILIVFIMIIISICNLIINLYV